MTAWQPQHGDKKPTCGAPIEGPTVRDKGRSRPLWRSSCHRRVKAWGERCYQHRETCRDPDWGDK